MSHLLVESFSLARPIVLASQCSVTVKRWRYLKRFRGGSSNDVKSPAFSGVSIVSCQNCHRRDEAIQDLLHPGMA
ncbi:hypothetical protein DY000_02015777 [Brassica cretica]|uniref:Uncharacterized protein n=1 Tax=Brassica cretica TaxID=69181 RepID=A0ABQ7CT27_BRACR|nr:hypothetical protein DY000_02015777 [Brassica cretica]